MATSNAVPPNDGAANFNLPGPTNIDVGAAKVNTGGAITITPPPPSAAMKMKQHDSSGESDIGSSDIESDSDASSTSSSSSPPPNKIDRSALTSELATSNIDTAGLSDYELLRLRNIQRNEAKLKSLGLFEGITSKLPKGAHNNNKSEQGRKAAETRRRNKMLAREKVERHNREMEELRLKSRVQPQRTVKASTANYYSAKAPSKRRMQWEANLSLLRSFHKQFGTFRISATKHGHGREYKSLQQWKCRQRKEYLLFKEGRKSVLDEEQVSLLEQLGADWLVGGMMRAFPTASASEGSASMMRGKRTTRQASNLWADYSDDDDYEEEQKILAEWEGENHTEEEEDDEEDGRGEVAIGSSDSFSVVSEESEQYQQHAKKNSKSRRAYYSEPYGKVKSFNREHDLDSNNSEYTSQDESLLQHLPQRKQQKLSSISTSRRRSRRVKRSVSKKSRKRDDSPPMKRSKRRLVSSLEVVAPAEIESRNWSSASLKRSRSYEDEDEYNTPRRSSRRRLSAYSRREEESIVSAEEETSFQAGSSKRRRRKRYVHQRSSRRDEGYEEVIEKPMEEIIVRDIDMQAERDQLMAEYGALYGRKCVLLEKRDQVEKELRGMEFARKLLKDVDDPQWKLCRLN